MQEKFKHNKKRNAGLLFEFLSTVATKSILEGRDKTLSTVKQIINKYFKEGTQLHEEFKVSRALFNAQFERPAASSFLSKIKEANKNIKQAKLEEEKTGLLFDISLLLKEEQVFMQPVENYKMLATIQVLLNAWRNSSSLLTENISTIVELEEQVLEHIIKPKEKINAKEVFEMKTTDVDHLVVNIMMDKINKKYGSLNEEQRKIISLYVLLNEDNKPELIKLLEEIKSVTSNLIVNLPELQPKLEKVVEAMSQQDYSPSILTEDSIVFYLGVAKLNEDIKREEGKVLI